MSRVHRAQPTPRKATLLRLAIALSGVWAAGACAGRALKFSDELIPRFSVPRAGAPPVIDGVIRSEEWRESLRIAGIGHDLNFRDRPVSFYVAWDPGNLYLAARSDIIEGHALLARKTDRYTTGTVHDDAYEFGVRAVTNRPPEAADDSFLTFILNPRCSGEYTRRRPSTGQESRTWQPDMRIASGVRSDANGRRWWEMEVAVRRDDLELPRDHSAGDLLRMLLAADLKNPRWQWLHVPTASGHLDWKGFPYFTLSDQHPYVQVHDLGGMHDEALRLDSRIHNPTARTTRVTARVIVQHGQAGPLGMLGTLREPVTVVDVTRTLTLPPNQSLPFQVYREFPGLAYPMKSRWHPAEFSTFAFSVHCEDDPDGPPLYSCNLNFRKEPKTYLTPLAETKDFDCTFRFDPVGGRLFFGIDTLRAVLPPGAQAAAASYRVTAPDGSTVTQGRARYQVQYRFEDVVQLPDLAAGQYHASLSLLDAQGKVLATRSDFRFEKKDEAREFREWWRNRIGHCERVLEPFEPVGVREPSKEGTTDLSCVGRVYSLNGIGLPTRIESSGTQVLAAPVSIRVLREGHDQAVPAAGPLRVTGVTPWKVGFAGEAWASGMHFASVGSIEQDGMVELDLTMSPADGPVEIEALTLEWPIDDSHGLHMTAFGIGGSFAARNVGRVPPGEGQVWSSLDDIGLAGCGMSKGSFLESVWLGTEKCGLLWSADSDRGWVPDDRVAAHSLVRTGGTVVLRNHLIGPSPDGRRFLITAPRTVTLRYNASPFRPLIPGWRIHQVAPANGSAGGKYKVNWDTGQPCSAMLSPPFADRARWEEYLEHCRRQAQWRSARSPYRVTPRLGPYLANQTNLRGQAEKTAESTVTEYFAGNWLPDNESLAPTYRDYMAFLQDLLARRGGCSHFHYATAFTGQRFRHPAAGLGYRLPDGHLQPEGGDGAMRRWFMRSWAVMQDAGHYPGGVSAHAPNAVSLACLPWIDALVDSEFPTADSVAAYPSDRMIAMSCPHTFGTNICHLDHMNPFWALMHDAGQAGGNGPFWQPEFLHWGISRADVTFTPYWRNRELVREITPGILASVWRRPGRAVLALFNYGPDPAGRGTRRSLRVRLDLEQLGIPPGTPAEWVWVRELWNPPIAAAHAASLEWFRQLPPVPSSQSRTRPEIRPLLNCDSGVLEGFDIDYHDARIVAVYWDRSACPVELQWELGASTFRRALDWGLTRAQELNPFELDWVIRSTLPEGLDIRLWRQPDTCLVHIANTHHDPRPVALQLDMRALGIDIRKKWAQFTSIVSLDGEPVTNEIELPDPTDPARGAARFHAPTGTLTLQLDPGERRTVVLDRY